MPALGRTFVVASQSHTAQQVDSAANVWEEVGGTETFLACMVAAGVVEVVVEGGMKEMVSVQQKMGRAGAVVMLEDSTSLHHLLIANLAAPPAEDRMMHHWMLKVAAEEASGYGHGQALWLLQTCLA